MGSVPMKREKKKVDMRMRKRKINKKRKAGLATRALVSLADLAGRSTSAHANFQPKGNIKLKKTVRQYQPLEEHPHAGESCEFRKIFDQIPRVQNTSKIK